MLFLSTPSARRATLVRPDQQDPHPHFYPRPPRGGRHAPPWPCSLPRYFYPRPPRGGRRPTAQHSAGHITFLSTPSARRATVQRIAAEAPPVISIHALREEGDGGRIIFAPAIDRFLSTPSARRATQLPVSGTRHWTISIHALREEGDPAIRRVFSGLQGFLSTPSARRATKVNMSDSLTSLFLSTPSARRATAKTEKNISAFVSL